MPLFLGTREPLKREKLILGGAITFRPRGHRLKVHRFPIHKTRQKMIPPATLATTAPKRTKRPRGVSVGRRRGATSRRRLSRAHPAAPKQRAIGRRRSVQKKAAKRQTLVPHKVAKNIASEAKRVIHQLGKSRQIQRAVKDVVAQSDLSAIGNQLVNRVTASVGKKSRKRLPDADDATGTAQQQHNSPPSKRARFAPGYSPMDYRGKTIQRGGTKQKGGKFLF